MEADITMFKYSMQQASTVLYKLDSLALYMKDKNIESVSNLDFMCLSNNLGYRPFSWNRATLDELKSSGSLQFIEDDSLKMKIVQYDAFTNHLDQDYVNDRETVMYCQQLVSEIVNTNYYNIDELNETMTNIVKGPSVWEEDFLIYKGPQTFDFFSKTPYEMAKAQGLHLITDDINKVHAAVNNLIRLKNGLRIRVEGELPKLINDATELIESLKQTYLGQEFKSNLSMTSRE